MTDTKTLEDEITRLNSCLQYEQHRSNRISTHGPGCATWGPNHYECALRDLSAARAERDKLSAMLDHRNDEATEAELMLRAELSAAHERIKELEVNDRRYRWLRDTHPADGNLWVAMGLPHSPTGMACWREDGLDGAIDKAIVTETLEIVIAALAQGGEQAV